MSELEAALQFITAIEQQNFAQSPYEIANSLRGYTKPAYTTPAWTGATGYKQAFVKGTLNQTFAFAGETTDFGHFIAALSDQINRSNFKLSSLTNLTADHTSWAGDIGSAIAAYRAHADGTNPDTLNQVLSRLASESDYAADVAAFVIGNAINTGSLRSISQLIADYHAKPFSEHVKTFLTNRFGVAIVNYRLQMPEKVEAEIRRAVFTYLELSPESGIIGTVKNLFSAKPKLPANNNRMSIATDLMQGSLHFFAYLVRKGVLDPLTFHPYQLPQAPWLGTVTYEVKVPG